MRWPLIVSWIMSVMLAGLLGEAVAENPQARFDKVRTQYLKLRNTDLDIRQEEVWRKTVRDFQSFAREHPSHANAPSALYSAAIGLAELHRKSHQETDAIQAVDLLNRLYTVYPTSVLADDAMLRASDLLEDSLQEKEASRVLRARLLRQFPDSDAAMAFEARQNVRAQQQEKSASRINMNLPLVMLDPGHGGEDFGAQGEGGLLEKDVALLVAREVAKILTATGRVRVELTRDRDLFVPLAERTRLANEHGAQVFVSLHTNASPKQTLQGLQTYFLDVAGDEASKLLAERENQSMHFEIEESDLQFIISDLTQYGKLPDSVELANSLHRATLQQLRPRWGQVKDMGVRKAPFYVLVGAHMPCVLVEMLYLDNPKDGALLAKKEFRLVLAKGISKGIINFLDERSRRS